MKIYHWEDDSHDNADPFIAVGGRFHHTYSLNVFQSTIRIIAGERSINAKSLLGVVSFGFRQGQQVQVAADGPDEAEAVNALSQFFQSSASA